MKSTTATYVFCIVRAPKAPVMTRVPEALPEMGKPRALAAGKGVWLIVADAPLSLYGEATLNEKLKDMDWVSRCALAHEQIIEFASRAPAVLPMKLFTLFNSDDRALRLVEADPKRIARALDRVEGCAEYGVRLSIDELRARRQAEVRAAEQSRGSSGAAFLMRKKTLKEASAELTRGAETLATSCSRRSRSWWWMPAAAVKSKGSRPAHAW